MVELAFWSKKKIDNKIISYFIDKKIPYEVLEQEKCCIRFELCLAERQIMIYPYLTIDGDLVSFNVNITEHSLKGFDYQMLNQFNLESKFFKAYLTKEGIIALEYRFLGVEDTGILDSLIDNLFSMQTQIDTL